MWTIPSNVRRDCGCLRSTSSLPVNRRRVVACYCATFLKPEMQHIYRPLVALRRYHPVVFTRKRENAAAFPFEDVVEVPAGPWRWLRRIVFRQLLKQPILLSRGETRRLRARLDEYKSTLLHIVFGNTAIQLLPLLREASRRWPAVVSFHGADVLVELDRPAYRQALLEMLGRVDLVLARSQSLIEALVRLGCPPEKIRLNRTGIPLDQFPFKERAWSTDGQWRLFQACRLIDKKGLPTSLRAFAAFAKAYPQARLTIAGEGPRREELGRLAAELGVAGQVDFVGFLSQDALRARLYESHFFLHPSEQGSDGNQEGVPNAVLEAMATGLPVFATTHGGIPEAVGHGVNGILVPEGDHGALGRALLDLASDPVRLTAMAAAASKTVAEEFDLATQVRKLEGYYQEAIEEAWISPVAA